MPWAEITPSKSHCLEASTESNAGERRISPFQICRRAQQRPLASTHPTQLVLHQPAQPDASSYSCAAPCHHSGHSYNRCLLPQSMSLGLSFCPVTNSKPRLFRLASETPGCKPFQHTANTALELTGHNHRNPADRPPVPRSQYCRSYRQSAANAPSTRIKSGCLQLSLRVTRSVSPRMLTPNTHGLNVNCSYYGLQPSASPSRDSFPNTSP